MPLRTHASRAAGSVFLLRHGETEWSASGRHTGVADVALTPRGECEARVIANALAGQRFALALVSPMQRARRTAELARIGHLEIDPDLREWDYGAFEGLTTPQIREQVGYQWTVFADGVPPGTTPGESIEEVAVRARRVLDRCAPALQTGDVILVAHGHYLRVLATVWLRQEPRLGAQLQLTAGSLSVLGHEHDIATITSWNRPAQV